MIVTVIGLVVIGLALFYFSRTNKGEQLIDQNLHGKPDLTKAGSWLIGPIDNQGNQSLNMPEHPVETSGGLLIDMPTPQSQPHYVTVDYGSLTGKSKITLNVNVEGGPFFAKDGTSQATICLYFQRQFDDWSATVNGNTGTLEDTNNNTQYYRWFATATGWAVLSPGEFTLTASLSDKWTALQGDSEDSLNPHQGAPYFKAAVDNAGEVGFVLGGGDGWGHGIMSPNPSKIIVASFTIE